VAATESDPPLIAPTASINRRMPISTPAISHEAPRGSMEFPSRKTRPGAKSEPTFRRARSFAGTIGDGKEISTSLRCSRRKSPAPDVADPASKNKPPRQRRLDFLAARLPSEERRLEIAEQNLLDGASANFDQDKSDYFWLLNAWLTLRQRRSDQLDFRDET